MQGCTGCTGFGFCKGCCGNTAWNATAHPARITALCQRRTSDDPASQTLLRRPPSTQCRALEGMTERAVASSPPTRRNRPRNRHSRPDRTQTGPRYHPAPDRPANRLCSGSGSRQHKQAAQIQGPYPPPCLSACNPGLGVQGLRRSHVVSVMKWESRSCPGGDSGFFLTSASVFAAWIHDPHRPPRSRPSRPARG